MLLLAIKDAKSLQSCPTLCNPVDHSPPGSSLHGILQARILEQVPFPPPGDLPDSGIEPTSPALAGGFLMTTNAWEAEVVALNFRTPAALEFFSCCSAYPWFVYDLLSNLIFLFL